MSLLLDALKRAEDAKRAKAEAAALQITSTPMPEAAEAKQAASARAIPEALALGEDAASRPNEPKAVGSVADPPATFPLLSLEVVDDRSDAPVASSPSKPASTKRGVDEAAKVDQATLGNSAPPPRMTLEEMLASELGYSDLETLAAPAHSPPATATFTASRLPPAQKSAEPLASHGSAPNLEPLSAPKSGTETVASTHRESAQQILNREAIRNVFAVKQVAPVSSGKAKWIFSIAGVLLAMMGAGSWYVWNEMNRFTKPDTRLLMASAAPAATAPAPPTEAPATSSRAGANTTDTSATATAAATEAVVQVTKTAAAPEQASLPPLLPPPATQLKEVRTPPVAKVVAAPPREALARQIQALPAPPNPNDGNDKVMLRPAKATKSEINPALAAGYAALSVGDYTSAKRHYAEAIAADGSSADAHLGFATAAARTGNIEDLPIAMKHYRRVLEIDPRNSTARAALIVLANDRDSNSAGELMSTSGKEAALRLLIAQDPGAANAHFLLGNLHAQSRQWREAQPAYFEAARLMPQNADYNYNLAVSLDQLGQGAAALNFYRRALAANVKGQFDRSAVERRIATLSPSLAEASTKHQP